MYLPRSEERRRSGQSWVPWPPERFEELPDHPIGAVRLALLKLIVATTIAISVQHVTMHNAESYVWLFTWVLTLIIGASLVRRDRATAFLSGVAVIGNAVIGMTQKPVDIAALCSLGIAVLAAVQWWEAMRLPLWPRSLYRLAWSEGWHRYPATTTDNGRCVRVEPLLKPHQHQGPTPEVRPHA
ncbi:MULTISPECIES: hypothetical protein [Saccharothrix]|uniref:hypothetical protein n=1 Tax=Saccharothrix TaxID=2071 RepID=UPI00095E7F9E|nr:hypothetical protein [Saccharothrix sp. CB00851]OKI24892.1 hypothetical protein A6A25_33320 [Saccharothrix sp. CB00851]